MKKSKKIYKTVLSILILAFFSFQLPSVFAAEVPPQLNIVIDASGSMGQKIEGTKTKMQVAKEAVGSLVDSLPASSYVGLRAYGSQYPESAKNCTDTKQLVPISALNKTEIKNQVNALVPKGWTLMAYSLQKAYEDFISSDSERVIVLVSDGEETCGGNLCQVAKDLEAKGVKLTVNTIGFSVNQTAKSQLQCVAEATGGKYYDATNTAQLNSSLTDATAKIRNPITYTTEGEKITGGSGFEVATPIDLSKPYQFDIIAGEKLFFFLNVPAGQEIKDISATAKIQNTCNLSLHYKTFQKNRKEFLGYYDIVSVISPNAVETSVIEFRGAPADIHQIISEDGGLYLSVDSDLSFFGNQTGCDKKPPIQITLNSSGRTSQVAQVQPPATAYQQDFGQTQPTNQDSQFDTDSSTQPAPDITPEDSSENSPKKSNLPLFIGLVVLVGLIIAGAAFYLIKKGGPKPPSSGGSTPAKPPVFTAPQPSSSSPLSPPPPPPPSQPPPQ